MAALPHPHAMEDGMRKVTSSLLRQKGACVEQIHLFVALGGDDRELTEALCIEHAEKFEWSWAACHLLSPKARAEYCRVIQPAEVEYGRIQKLARTEFDSAEQPAWAEYMLATQAALRTYERTRKSARSEQSLAKYERGTQAAREIYERVRQPAWTEYERVIRVAAAKYDRIRIAARAEYRRTCSVAFYRAWTSDIEPEDSTRN